MADTSTDIEMRNISSIQKQERITADASVDNVKQSFPSLWKQERTYG
jgi:hypothetical protein